MTVATKVSTCVDCATTIIGERLRCPACHDRHAAALVANPSRDDDRTVPRPRSAEADVLPKLLARWVVVIELLIIVALGVIFAARGCLP